MTRDTKQSDQRRRWIRRLLAGPAILLGIAVATIACMVVVTAVLMALDGVGVRAAWLTPVVMFPFLVPFYYIAAKTSVWLSSIFERITGTEDDLTAFLRQVTYVETGPENGHWIDRGGRIYEDEAALMRGVKRFAKERDS